MHVNNVSNQELDRIQNDIVGTLYKYEDHNMKLEKYYQSRINQLIGEKNQIKAIMRKRCENEIKNCVNIVKGTDINGKNYENNSQILAISHLNDIDRVQCNNNKESGNMNDNGIVDNVNNGKIIKSEFIECKNECNNDSRNADGNVNGDIVKMERIKLRNESSNNDSSYYNSSENSNANGKISYHGAIDELKENKSVNQASKNDSNVIFNANNVEIEERLRNKIDSMVKNNVKDRYKWQCHNCNEKFQKRRDVRIHIARRHIRNEDKVFKCDQCDKAFAMICLLNNHKIIHTSKYECRICQRRFGHWLDLKRHREKHSNEKQFRCQYCRRSYKSRHDCKRHEKSHQYDKHYRCERCRKSFARSDDLRTHLRKCFSDF